MLRPVRSVPRPGAPAPSVAAVRSGATLREAAKDGLDVGKNAFLLAHGYVTLDELCETPMLERRFSTAQCIGNDFPRKCGHLEMV
jgi:hypothetical protein